MKDSGIAWVGEIPQEWQTMPLYCLYSERKNINALGKENNLLSLSYGKVVRKDINTSEGLLPSNYNGYNIVECDDIIIRPTDLQNDKRSLRTGLAKERGIITSAYIALKPKQGVNSHYFHYLLHSYDISKVFYNMGNGVRQGLNYDEFAKLIMLVSSNLEQQRIADFLDKECEKIDGLKTDIQLQIDTLEQYKRSVITEAVTHGLNHNAPVKDSGVDYIDEIKADWKISKIGFVCTKLTRGFSEDDPALICSNKGNVVFRDEQHACGKMVSEDNAMQGIHIGDIAIHGMDTWHGAIGFSKIRGKITRVVHVCDSTEDKRFVVYYLKSLAYQGVYKLISNGIRGNTSDFRSWDKVKDIYICLPPLDEQKGIADYLDHKCTEIEQIIANKNTQLETLDEYKKSMIYEYVTGKKEVA
ncbi:MAG: restriction endonuclease subunit S [Treponemataceae bacterium]|nr:restriction endonuclease subunit S [Treponemataceae bacterium]